MFPPPAVVVCPSYFDLTPTHLFTFLQVYDLMLHDERFYPSFKQSPLYVRMLAELDMLKEPSYRGSDDGEGESFNGSPTGSISLVSRLHFLFQSDSNQSFSENAANSRQLET